MVPEIIVKGAAELRVMPDFARVRVDVDGDGETREAAYAAAARPAGAVDTVLDACSDLLGGVTGSALVVQPKTRWRKGESVRTGWRAARSTTVEVIALEELGGLLGRLAAAEAAVAGPWWEIAPDNAAFAQVRAAAARDARGRADAYATGLGLVVGEVAWSAEPGLRRGWADEEWSEGREELMALSARGVNEDEPQISVAPVELTISAAVEVGFAFGPAGT